MKPLTTPARAALILLLTTLACAAPVSLPSILQDDPTDAPPPTESALVSRGYRPISIRFRLPRRGYTGDCGF